MEANGGSFLYSSTKTIYNQYLDDVKLPFGDLLSGVDKNASIETISLPPTLITQNLTELEVTKVLPEIADEIPELAADEETAYSTKELSPSEKKKQYDEKKAKMELQRSNYILKDAGFELIGSNGFNFPGAVLPA